MVPKERAEAERRVGAGGYYPDHLLCQSRPQESLKLRNQFPPFLLSYPESSRVLKARQKKQSASGLGTDRPQE